MQNKIILIFGISVSLSMPLTNVNAPLYQSLPKENCTSSEEDVLSDQSAHYSSASFSFSGKVSPKKSLASLAKGAKKLARKIKDTVKSPKKESVVDLTELSTKKELIMETAPTNLLFKPEKKRRFWGSRSSSGSPSKSASSYIPAFEPLIVNGDDLGCQSPLIPSMPSMGRESIALPDNRHILGLQCNESVKVAVNSPVSATAFLQEMESIMECKTSSASPRQSEEECKGLLDKEERQKVPKIINKETAHASAPPSFSETPRALVLAIDESEQGSSQSLEHRNSLCASENSTPLQERSIKSLMTLKSASIIPSSSDESSTGCIANGSSSKIVVKSESLKTSGQDSKESSHDADVKALQRRPSSSSREVCGQNGSNMDCPSKISSDLMSDLTNAGSSKIISERATLVNDKKDAKGLSCDGDVKALEINNPISSKADCGQHSPSIDLPSQICKDAVIITPLVPEKLKNAPQHHVSELDKQNAILSFPKDNLVSPEDNFDTEKPLIPTSLLEQNTAITSLNKSHYTGIIYMSLFVILSLVMLIYLFCINKPNNRNIRQMIEEKHQKVLIL